MVGRKGNIGGAQLFNSGCWPIDTTYFFTIPSNLNAKFLALQLAAQNWKNLDSSTATPSLRREDLEAIRLVIPPLAEQNRIVEALEDHLARLDAASAALRRSLARTAHLRQSTIRRALRGQGITPLRGEDAAEDFQPRSLLAPHEQPWSIPEGWLWTTIGSLFKVYVGTTPSRKVPELWSGSIPWVSSGEVSFGRISGTREHIAETAVGNRKTRLHPPGTVMIAMIGEGKTRGQAAILDIEAAHNQNCASIRVS
ncbi:restriction endonuclease subunit S, partial [Streptomyces sp. TRM76130]|nr:restriction endonuclease subunit S [Streptomyces sp. TRM76130]